MKKPVNIFRRSNGLNTVEDPARLTITDKGTVELAVAVNVEHDRSGRVSRRKGYVRKLSGSFHSLFPAGDYALVVQDESLLVLEKDYTTSFLRTVSPRAPMDYEKVGDSIYYCNGHERGIVRGRVNSAWKGLDLVGPNSTKAFSDPPTGHLLTLYNGRMYIAQEIMDRGGLVHHILWYTEPFSYSSVNLAKNFIPLEHRIVTLDSLADSLIVGTTGGVYVFIGANPDEFALRRLSSAPVVARSAALVNGELIGDGDHYGEMLMMATHEGLCLIGSQGYFKNLTSRKIKMPAFREGCAAVINDKYLCCLYE